MADHLRTYDEVRKNLENITYSLYGDANRFQWLLDNATLTCTLRQGVKYWSLEVRGDYPEDAGMADVRDMLDVSRST